MSLSIERNEVSNTVLLRTFNLSRSEAYRQVEGEWAHRFPVARTGTLLERLAADEVPVSIAYANRGAILVHRGIVERVAAAGNAVCILDPGLRADLELLLPIVDRWANDLIAFAQNPDGRYRRSPSWRRGGWSRLT